jgi:hypothetical protein
MLKWFRQHNKWILVFGMSFLMIAFLVPMSALQMFGKPQDEAIGSLAGQKLTMGDRQIADGQMQVLRRISLVHFLPLQASEDPVLRWMLMLHEAKAMGLSASEAEINEILETETAKKTAKDFGVTVEAVREIVRDGITVHRYMYMVDPDWWMRMPLPPQMRQLRQMYSGRGPSSYMTRPLLKHLINDEFASVGISMVEVSSDTYVKKASASDAKALNALFEKYKGEFKDKGEPYGFGYKFTDRVKLEYISIPLDRLIKKVKIRDDEIFSHYQNNKKDFQIPLGPPQRDPNAPPTAMGQQSYEEARGRIINLLTSRKARAMADEIIQLAQNLLSKNARTVPEDHNGFRDVASALKRGWKPLPLPEVVNSIQKQFDVLVDYSKYDQEWLDREALGNLKGIGAATLPMVPGNRSFKPPFVITEQGVRDGGFDYVMSARGFEAKEHQLAKHRLQAMLPGKPLEGADGSRYLFRLLDVSKSREPKNLDEVRGQVEKNAQSIAAYKFLQGQSDQWLKRAATEDFKEIAKELKVSVLSPSPFPRRRSSQAPPVTPIGISKQFVDAVWAVADQVQAAGGVEKASMKQRAAVVAVDRKRNLYLVRIDKLSPMSKSMYNIIVSSSMSQNMYAGAMFSDRAMPRSPLSLFNLGKRLGYIDAEGKSLKSPDDSTDSQAN